MNSNLPALCALVLISEKARYQAKMCGEPNVVKSLLEIDEHAKTAIKVLRAAGGAR